ncbi:MAG TPA: helix-turn-helix domain-containing protein [Candidatus Binatia bacterium]|nr:helix-turn-helix domain-containing protein [Candidatus Binatia bacterium]
MTLPSDTAAAVAAGPEGLSSAKALGTMLRQARTSKGLSREDLAGRLFVSSSTLQRMEDGDPRVAFGYYLGAARVLGLPILALELKPELLLAATGPGRKTRARRQKPDWF